MCAAGTLMAAGGRRRLLMTVCLGAAVAAAACGAATRAAPRVAPEGSPAAVASDCEIGTAAFERRDFAAAAEAFDRCIQANPTLAYAYYRAGLAYYEIDRPDQMVNRFETFMRLAPDAPERPQVESILKATAARR